MRKQCDGSQAPKHLKHISYWLIYHCILSQARQLCPRDTHYYTPDAHGRGKLQQLSNWTHLDFQVNTFLGVLHSLKSSKMSAELNMIYNYLTEISCMSLIVIGNVFIASLDCFYKVQENLKHNRQILEDLLFSQDIWDNCHKFIVIGRVLHRKNVEVKLLYVC